MIDINIDPKDVLELAAQKVADNVLSQYEDLYEIVTTRIKEEINSVITKEVRQSMTEVVDKTLADELQKVLSQEIVPVDMWGERVGEPTTIKEQLHKRALVYWEERVEKDNNNRGHYRVTSYGGQPRHKIVFQDVAQEAFDAAIKENVNEMVKAFRDAVRKDACAVVTENIDKIINNKIIGN